MVGVIERKEKFFFDAVWVQAHLEHTPSVAPRLTRSPYRIGVVSLPPPTELGEAYFVGLVVKTGDPIVLAATSRSSTTTCSRRRPTAHCSANARARDKKHSEGPVMTGSTRSTAAFIDAFMELIVPTKVTSKPDRQW